MITERPKIKHRTPEETLFIERQIVGLIEQEQPLKNLGPEAGLSDTYAYQIAKRLGYSQMLVSEGERATLREIRGTSKLFRRWMKPKETAP